MNAQPGRDYPDLHGLRVSNAMHPAVITCSLDSPLRTIARTMATYRVHAILVTAHGDEKLPGGDLWGIVSDADLLRAAESGDIDEQTARSIAAHPVPDSGDRGARACCPGDGRAGGLASDRDRAPVGQADRSAVDTRHRQGAGPFPGAIPGFRQG